MSNKVYGFCDAGCRYPVTPLEDFLNSAALGKIPLTDGKSDPLNPFQKYKVRSAKDTYGAFTGKPYLKVPAGNEFSFAAGGADEYRTHYDFELIDYSIASSDTGYKTVTVIFEINGQRTTNEIAVLGSAAVEPFAIVFKDCEELYVYNDGTNVYQPSHLYRHKISVSKSYSEGDSLFDFSADCIVYSTSDTPITVDTFKDKYLIGARTGTANPSDSTNANYPVLNITFNETSKTFYVRYLTDCNLTGSSVSLQTLAADQVTITDTVEEV